MWEPGMIAALAAVGAVAGVLAGLLGLGGGMFIIPAMSVLLAKMGVGSAAQHVAIGTSFAIMIFTSLSGALTHMRCGHIEWPIFKIMLRGVVAGVVVGSLLASFLDGTLLRWFFGFFTFSMSILTILKAFDIPKTPPADPKAETGRARSRHLAAGAVIGSVSSWLGIGGGGMTVPYLLFNRVEAHKAVGTAAALTWPVSVAGAVMYVALGMGSAPGGWADGYVGYVYFPAFLVLVACTSLCAPVGAKLSARFSPKQLKIMLAAAFALISAHTFWNLTH